MIILMRVYNNLKPFTGAADPRRQNGRKKGSKNLSTIVIEMLGQDISPNLPINGPVSDFITENEQSTTYAKAVALSMIIKAINGDVRAATWVSNYADKQPDEPSLFDKTSIVFNVVQSRKREQFEES